MAISARHDIFTGDTAPSQPPANRVSLFHTVIAGILRTYRRKNGSAAEEMATVAAMEAYVTAAVNALVDSAPGSLNTLNELAAAINDDSGFHTTVLALIGAKAASSITITGAGLATGGGDLTANRTITVTEASQAEAEAYHLSTSLGTVVLTPRRLRQAIHPPYVTLAYGASVTPNCNDGLRRKIALAGDMTINKPTNAPADGAQLEIRITADGSPREVTLHADIKYPSDAVDAGFTGVVEIPAAMTHYLQFEYNGAVSEWNFKGSIGGFTS